MNVSIMIRNGIIIVFLFLSSNIFAQRELSILALNIWHEGTVVEGGYEAIVDEVERLKPDFVAFSEVRNYNNSDFGKRMVSSLKRRGFNYYSFKSYDSGLLSKYPIIDSTTIFYSKTDNGSIYKLVANVEGKRIAVYTAHLDYLNCAYYLPRGYDGNTWKYSSNPVTLKEVRDMNLASQRYSSISKFIKDANSEYEKGAIVILGGDFNEPSMLDWTEETKDLYDHNGIVYQWDTSKLLLENGFIDAYRELYPSVIDYPGFTYPSANKDKPIKTLTWAPKSDERERIDFIYFKSKELILKDISILGPKKCIKNSEEVLGNTKDKFIEPKGVWPTDHKGLFAKFKIKS